MGFFDFLKGIIPEKLINIDNRKIEVTHSSIVVGDQTINDPEIIDKLFDKIAEHKREETLPAQVIHKDLDKSYADYEGISIREKESIKKLRTVLPESEIECILEARRIALAYHNKDVDLAKKLHGSLCENYPDKGSKVFNLIGGGYFDELVIPFIDIFKSQYEDGYAEKFREFYFGILKFFPLALFVGNHMSKEQILEGIHGRLRLAVPFIRLHAIGDNNIKTIEEAVEEIHGTLLEEQFSIQDNRFTSPSGMKAQILEIKISRDKQSPEQ